MRYDCVGGYHYHECEGLPFVPRFERMEDKSIPPFQRYKHYWNSWRELMKRAGGKDYEPCALSHKEWEGK